MAETDQDPEPTEMTVPDADPKPPENAAKVSKKDYPERPYSEAISAEHKKVLKEQGIRP